MDLGQDCKVKITVIQKFQIYFRVAIFCKREKNKLITFKPFQVTIFEGDMKEYFLLPILSR